MATFCIETGIFLFILTVVSRGIVFILRIEQRIALRVPIARRVQPLNVALTMNLLAIFSSLVPDGEKAWLPGGFSARVFYVQRR